MIQIKKPKYEHDNYCVCCRKPFEDSMQISFLHKDYKDSVSITLCGKCREELKKAMEGEAHWIKKYTPDDGEIYECDNCGVTWQFNDGGPEENEAFFCPKCGFKMERGEADE